jgi:transcriptional regulator with XRE-family HTH domain
MTNNKKPKEAFGEVLRAMRRRAGLSQDQLAEKAGLDRTYISILERSLQSPSLDTMIALSTALGVTFPQLAARVWSRLTRTGEDG